VSERKSGIDIFIGNIGLTKTNAEKQPVISALSERFLLS
jgi:hypothetical protein